MAKSLKTLHDIMYDISLRRPTEPVHIGDNCYVGRQIPEGRSIWAQWVRDGLVDQDHIWWAWRIIQLGPVPSRDFKKEWLGFFANSGHNKPVFCNLQTQEGRKALKELEKRTAAWLSKKH